MSLPPPAAALFGRPDDVEAQFYDALRHGDLERLMALWADDDDIVCVHPSGGRAVGAAAIRASFEAIFGGSGPIPVQPEQVRRLVQLGSALHHLVERITVTTPQGPHAAWVVASNWYVKTPQGWRIAAHHASPAQTQEPLPAAGETPAVLH